MKRFTVLLTIVGVLAFWAVFQALSGARAEAKSASISPVYDSTGAMLDAIRPKKAAAATYQAVLGKSLEDKDIAEFVASNCSSAASQFQLCEEVGMALRLNAGQVVETVYLYPASVDGFSAYKGQLPLGLTFNDTMASVEQKFGQPKEVHALQAGWEPGLPDEGGSPDHLHFWAVYERFGVIVVYNSPFANDKNASIHSILVMK